MRTACHNLVLHSTAVRHHPGIMRSPTIVRVFLPFGKARYYYRGIMTPNRPQVCAFIYLGMETYDHDVAQGDSQQGCFNSKVPVLYYPVGGVDMNSSDIRNQVVPLRTLTRTEKWKKMLLCVRACACAYGSRSRSSSSSSNRCKGNPPTTSITTL